nr:unnamed protein product [Callosobruchus analis]
MALMGNKLGCTELVEHVILCYHSIAFNLIAQEIEEFEWTPDCDDAFKKIKEHLITAPVLSCPDYELPFVVETDASNLKDPSGRLARWSLKLCNFDCKIVHRKGKDLVVRDMLSRSVTVLDELGSYDCDGKAIDKWYTGMKQKTLNNPARQFSTLIKKYKSSLRYNTNYHPQANPTERVNSTLKTMLASYVADNHRNWDLNLAKIECALRTARHDSTNPIFC